MHPAFLQREMTTANNMLRARCGCIARCFQALVTQSRQRITGAGRTKPSPLRAGRKTDEYPT
jgi:hypothetical protein